MCNNNKKEVMNFKNEQGGVYGRDQREERKGEMV